MHKFFLTIRLNEEHIFIMVSQYQISLTLSLSHPLSSLTLSNLLHHQNMYENALTLFYPLLYSIYVSSAYAINV